MSNFILVFYCCKTSHLTFTGIKQQKLLLFSPLVLGIGWAQLGDSSCGFTQEVIHAEVISKACSLQFWLLMLAVNWDLNGGCCQEHHHVTFLCSLGFLTTWWLSSKDCVPRENQAEAVLPFLAYPQKSHNLTSAILFEEAAIRPAQVQGERS